MINPYGAFFDSSRPYRASGSGKRFAAFFTLGSADSVGRKVTGSLNGAAPFNPGRFVPVKGETRLPWRGSASEPFRRRNMFPGGEKNGTFHAGFVVF
jgi:hypothetical protein